jgi:hypothetical protein
MARSRVILSAENAILRHQLAVLQRGRPSPFLRPADRVLWIRRISSDHPEWGEDRIALELKAKLGVVHPPSTIRRYMVTRKGEGAPASSTWGTFLAGHAPELWTLDLTTQPVWNYSVRYVLVLMEPQGRARGSDRLTDAGLGEAAG